MGTIAGNARQRIAIRQRIEFIDLILVAGGRPRQRVQGKAIAKGRIARNQIHAFCAHKPGAASPLSAIAIPARNPQRQHIAHHFLQPLFENLGEPRPILGIGKLGVKRIDIDRQLALFP